MARALKLTLVSMQASGAPSRAELGTVSGEEVAIGREPPSGGIVLPSQAVSRTHGLFTAVRNHWFFRDSGSTNGSWINTRKIRPGEWVLVKPGDLLQLADSALEIAHVPAFAGFGGGIPNLGIRSLLVFSRGGFLDEYPIPEYGRALVIGGSKADLKLDIDIHELPALVIERRGDMVCAFSISKEVPVQCNGVELTHTATLKDRDELSVDHYSVIFNDVSYAGASRYTDEAAGAPAEAPRANFGSPQGKGKPTLEYQSENSETPEIPEGESNAGYQDSELGEAGERSVRWIPDAQVPDFRTAQSARQMDRLPFGRMSEPEESGKGIQETIALDPAALRASIVGYDVHPAMRNAILEQPEAPLSALEDKIWLAIGFVMVLALVGLVVWWMIS